MTTLKSHHHTNAVSELKRTDSSSLEDVDCLKCEVLEETDAPRLTRGLRGKSWCSGKLLMSWSTWRSWRSCWPEGSRIRGERGGGRQTNPCCSLFNVELGWNVEHDSTFYIHVVNIVWNSDWYCSYYEIWVQLFSHRHNGAMKDYWVDAKWVRTRSRLCMNSTVALSENNNTIVPFVSTHPRTRCAASCFLFRGCTTLLEQCSGVEIMQYPRFTDAYNTIWPNRIKAFYCLFSQIANVIF